MIHRARVAVGPKARSQFDSWVDVEVEGARSDAAAICGSLAAREARRVYPVETGLAAWVVRECSAAPLPGAGGRAPASYVLWDGREASVADHLLASLGDRCQLKRFERTRATTTNLSRFAGKARCERARDRLLAAHAQREAEAARAAQGFLRDQLRQLQEKAARVCEAARLSAGLEHAQRRALREVARTCGRGQQTSSHCLHAKQKLDVRTPAALAVDAGRAGRECANVQALVKLVRDRAARPQPVPDRPQPACRAE